MHKRSNGFVRTVVKLGVRGAAGYRIKEGEPLRVTELLFCGLPPLPLS